MSITVDGFDDLEFSKPETGMDLLTHFMAVTIQTFQSVHLSSLLAAWDLGLRIRRENPRLFATLLAVLIIKIGI